jgi:hypothetical protein
MSDSNTNKNQISGVKADPKLIKKLESDLKTAFKENRFDDLKKISDEIKKIDAGNHLADRILEKAESIKAESVKVANAAKIKLLEQRMQNAFKSGMLMDLAKIASEIKKIDPENKSVKKVEARIEKAKASLDAQVKKEQIKGLEIVIKDYLKRNKFDEAVKKANELLALDKNSGIALNALKKIGKTKKVDYKALITSGDSSPIVKIEESPKMTISIDKKTETVKPVVVAATPVKKEVITKKSGFFSKLFKKKEAKKIESKTATSVSRVTEQVKPAVAEVSKSVAPVVLTQKSDVKTENKAGFFTKLFKKKSDAKPQIKTEAKDVLNPSEKKIEVKKPEVVTFSVKKEAVVKKAGFLSQLFKKKEIKPVVAEVSTPVAPAMHTSNAVATNLEKKPEALKPSVKKEEVKKSGVFTNLFKKQEAKEVIKPELSKKETLSKAISAIMGQSASVKQEKPVTAPIKTVSNEIKPIVIEATKQVTPIIPIETHNPVAPIIPISEAPKAVESIVPEIKAPKQSIFKPIIPIKPPVTALKPEDIKVMSKEPEPEKVITVPLITPVKQDKIVESVTSQEVKGDKGNIFTKLFGKTAENEKPTESIIDTIVAQADHSEKSEKDNWKKEEDSGEPFLKFANLFLKFSVAFIVLSAGFFYSYNMDEGNTILSLVGVNNNAIQLKSAASALSDRQTQKDSLTKEIDKYKKGYQNDYKDTIDKIVANRMNWSDLIAKLNEVTESVYEKNALAQYVQYNNYSYDATTGQLTVSATLSDPLGKNLTKLAELENAFMYYPKDPSNPNDNTKPYFYGFQGFRSYAKTFNKATGRYTSSFSLSLSTRPEDTTTTAAATTAAPANQ